MIRMHLNNSSNVENDDFRNLTLQFVPQIIKPRLLYHNSGGADQCMFSTSKRSFWSPLILLDGILLFLLTDGSMLLWIWWPFSGSTCPVMEHKLCYHHMPWGLIMESGIKCRKHTARICCQRYSEIKERYNVNSRGIHTLFVLKYSNGSHYFVSSNHCLNGTPGACTKKRAPMTTRCRM